MLKNKSEAFAVFKKFQALVENRPDRKIKVLRSDRGGEFMSKDFIAHCEELGIEKHFSAPYTPQQNGVIERRNRTVVELTRSYLKEMHLPSWLWGRQFIIRCMFLIGFQLELYRDKPHIKHGREQSQISVIIVYLGVLLT